MFGKSLKSRIFYSITICVAVPLIMTIGISWVKLRKEMEKRQTIVYEENTLYLSSLCNSLFEEIKNKSLLIYYDEKTMDLLKKRKPLSEEEQKLLYGKASAIFYSDDDIESVALYMEKARLMIYKKRNQTSRFYKVENKDDAIKYFINYLDSGELQYQISTLQNNEKGEFNIVLDQNILDPFNNTVMKMEIIYNQSVFQPIFSKIGDESSRNFILDQNGAFIYEEFGEIFPNDLEEDIKLAPEGTSKTKNGDYVIIKKSLEKFPYSIVKCVSKYEILKPTIPYRNNMIAMFCIIIMIIAFLSIILSRLVRQPIRKFTQSITDFRKSDQTIVKKVNPEIDEMEELSDAFYLMMKEINQLIEEKSEAKYKEKKAQLTMLAVQINPHFLYNALQTLQFMALKRKAFEINAMLLSLGKILRYSLDWENEEVTLNEEFENVLEYLNIQKFRYVDELDLYVEKPEILPECKLPKMILQPLVENCFVHGFKGKTENYKIRLLIACNDDLISIKISDNGNGMDMNDMQELNQSLKNAEGYTPSQHTGLLSLNFRLRQWYPNASVHVSQTEWFCVEVRIPIS